MSTEGWIFMVGFRVFDVGLLILWLVWFFRLREDDDAPDDDGPGGGGPELGPRDDPKPGGERTPIERSRRRIRDHVPARPERPRRPAPAPAPLPARVRRPRSPTPATRRASGAR